MLSMVAASLVYSQNNLLHGGPCYRLYVVGALVLHVIISNTINWWSDHARTKLQLFFVQCTTQKHADAYVEKTITT